MKWKRQSNEATPDGTQPETAEPPAPVPHRSDPPPSVDEGLVSEMYGWLHARAGLIDGELRARAARDGVSAPADAFAIAARIADNTTIPIGAIDLLGFGNLVAVAGDDNAEFLRGIPLIFPQADGSELRTQLTDVIAAIRRGQPELFELLLEVQRLRNLRVAEAGDDYLAFARSRIADDAALRALNVVVNRRFVEHSLERHMLDNVSSKLERA